MQLTGTHDGFHHQTKWNIASLIYQNTNFERVRKISISGGSGGTPAPRAWPLPSHFHSCPLGGAIHQDPGRGHLPPAHKCMEQAIKLTLWQLFSHPFDGPVSAHLLQREGIKKSSSDVQKIMTLGGRWGWVGERGVEGGCVPEWSRANARLWSQNPINQCWRVAEKMVAC